MAAWLLAGANAAAEDDVPKKKRSALEKSFIVLCCFFDSLLCEQVSGAELVVLKSDEMVTLQIMEKANKNKLEIHFKPTAF